MTSQLCPTCQGKTSKGHIWDYPFPSDHPNCLKAYFGANREMISELFLHYVFDWYRVKDVIYDDTILIISILKITQREIKRALGELLEYHEEGDHDSFINVAGLRAIFEEDLFDSDVFWRRYHKLINPSDIYELMSHGYNLDQRLHHDYHQEVEDMVRGDTPMKETKFIYLTTALSAHHITTRERRNKNWAVFFTSIFLAKWISRYHRIRYEPGGAQFKLAQIRFETGSYQV